MPFDPLSRTVIGCALDVHRCRGPGLLESAYQHCLAHELSTVGIRFEMEKSIPIRYKNVSLDCGYRIDILVEDKIILEIKSVESLLPIHDTQLITYMRLSNIKIGLLMDFNVRILKTGLKRVVL
ncbi:MAG: GxxExxY protein [Verrucomicrobiota bacterium]|nr:GxxExxY protein [Verrucomicrobiota bacterium]